MDFLRTTLSAAAAIALTATASAKPVTLSAETNLRAAPGTKSEIITLIPQGSEIDVGECDAGWCKVKFGDKEGFAIGRNLGEAPPQTAAAPRTTNQADMQRLRRGYEQYFDGNRQNDVTGSVDEPQYSQNPQQQYAQPQQRYAQPRNARPQYQQQYDDTDDYDDDEDDVAAYVPAQPPPAYYRYGPYPRAYYGWGPGPYYYRRW